MKNHLATRKEFMNPVALQQIEVLSQKLIGSKALPNTIQNGAQLSMVLMAGYEAGMTPMEAINSFYIVNGKVTIWGQAVIRMLRRSGWSLEWPESTPTKATVTITKGNEQATESYTIEEAKMAGLLHKNPWKNHPTEMLRHKAIARAVRFTCPEVLNGHYVTEEIDGDAVVVDAKKEVEKKTLPQKTKDAFNKLWDELMELEEVPEDKREALLKKTLAYRMSVGSLDDLTVQQANELIVKTGEKINELKKEASEATESPVSDEDTPDDPEPEKEEKTEPTPKNGSEAKPDTSEPTVDEIDDVLNDLPEDMGGVKE